MARILLVDDNPRALRAISRLLSQEGHDVTTTVSSAEAYAALGCMDCDLILCDHRMPGKSGMELLAQIRDSYEERIPTIILSGGMRQAQITQALGELKVHSVLSKPCDAEELLAAVQSAVDGSAASGSR